ncbi:hypothetical protein [Neobacillus sp. 204]|uniref:hypothetical protein n=1 Tax=Neobacillus sp. 204 TaxID=3383351 RepID=UPI00397C8274
MYKDKPVFQWHYVCPVCKHVHTVRFYNEFINTYFDKVTRIEFDMWLNRKDKEKHNQLLVEYEIAKGELEKINNFIRMELL